LSSCKPGGGGTAAVTGAGPGKKSIVSPKDRLSGPRLMQDESCTGKTFNPLPLLLFYSVANPSDMRHDAFIVDPAAPVCERKRKHG
jgi:hypothetical protein